MTGQARGATTAARAPRRSTGDAVRLSQRDIDELLLTGEHYGAPYDLLAAALRVQPDRLPAIAARHLPDIQLRYATLLGRLAPALDGPGALADADAWYCILEGTREPSVAQAQAMALTELAAYTATSLAGEQRAILLAADDYSAVSGRVPLSNLYERGRSLGIGVQVSAQSWQGSAPPRTSGTGSRAPPTAASGS